MKKLTALLVLSTLLSCSGSGGDGGTGFQGLVPRWILTHKAPNGHFRDVFFFGNSGFVVGQNGVVFRTDDGGISWGHQALDPDDNFRDFDAIHMLNTAVGQIVGDQDAVNGRWWTTTSGGLQWVTLLAATTGFGPFTGVHILNINTSIMLTRSGTVRRVIGGVEDLVGLPAGIYYDIEFPTNGSTGYVCGAGGAMFDTSSTGANWSLVGTPVGADLHNMSWIDNSTGYVCGDSGTVIKTTTGGLFWSDLTPVTNTTENLRSIHFPINDQIGWACGANGTIIVTSDGGASWTVQNNTGSDLYGIFMVNTSIGYAVGDDCTILKTVDSGTNWNPIGIGDNSTFRAIDFQPNATTGYAVGDSGVIRKTINAGLSWAVQDVGGDHLRGVSATTNGSDIAYACGDNGTIIKTIDGGATWTEPQTIPAAALTENLLAINFGASTTSGWCVGTNGMILQTTNGTDWTQVGIGETANNLQAISVPGGGLTVFLAGDAGTVLETPDLGVQWNDRSVPAAGAINAIVALNPLVVYAGESNGTVHTSADGGATWPINAASGVTPLEGLAVSGNELWVVNGIVRKSTNGGTAWNASPDHSPFSMHAIWMDASGTNGFAAGDNGTVMKTVSGG